MKLLRAFLLIIASTVTVFAVPPTPVNAPRAHPLAPNPHTSVGLFWIYTDANTGRQWTGGTYKVKRCSGAACTPTSVVASGLATADYQDTGLSSNTIYGYRYVANDGADSGDSPTVYVTTLTSDSNLVQFPDSTWSNLLGPLVESAQIPYAYYTSTMTAQGQDVISKYPVVAPSGGSVGTGRLSGTGSISNGSTTLTGSGTFFLEQVAANNPTCLDAISINGVNAGAIASVNSNTSITLASAWTGSTVSGVNLTTNISGLCGAADPLGDYLTGNQLMYYDSQLALWQIYFMTGDPQYLRGAIQGSESLFAGWMHLGRNRDALGNADSGVPPRNVQFSGLLLLGMSGHNGVWDQLDKYLGENYPKWISNYRGGNNAFQYPREKAYVILFTAWFIMAAPDSFPRSDGTTTSLNGSITVDGDLTDGRKDFYRDQLDIDLPGFITDDQLPWGFWVDAGLSNSTGDGDYPYVGGEATGPAQPFIQGLVGDALGYCWRTTALSSGARDAARKLTLRVSAAMGLLSYNTNLIPQDTSKRWRTIWYFFAGGNRLNPYAFQHGADSFVLNDTPYSNAAALNRQSIPLMLSTFGWAWEMSGQSWYKTIADEMANAAFAAVGENTGGTGDGLKSLCDSDANYKDFGQCYRTSARYFGNRTASPSSLGTAPVVTMPSDVTLTNGVNQASLTASVSCTNTPCNYRWGLQEYPAINNPRYEVMPVFTNNTALSTKLCGLEAGTYKLIFYALDSLGLEGHGTVNVTVGDGVFAPVAVIGYGNPSAEEQHQYFTTSSTLDGSVRAYSLAGRTLTHSFSSTRPKDKSAPTITPSGSTGNLVTFTVSGLSAGLWTITDTITDSAGAVRKTYMYIRHTAESQPSAAHNTIPTVSGLDQVLPSGTTSTRLYVVPRDPEGIVGYSASATGYTLGENGDLYLVTALSHSWSQIAGPVTATITNGNTIRPDITGLTQPGKYTFRYTGTDQQNDTVTKDINVTVQGVTIYQFNAQHGQGTDNAFNFQRQIDNMTDADIVTVQERTSSETGWNTPLSNAGMSQAVYLENNTTEGDGPAIWTKTATVTVDGIYTRALNTGTNPSCGSPNVGWDCSTDVRKSAVAAKVTVSGRQFYVVSAHLCWSRCNDSNVTTVSVQRENQANDLISWINSTLTGGLDVIILGDMNFAPNYAKSGGGLIKDIFTGSYTDLWNSGISGSKATVSWGDRNSDSIADMPLGDLTTRTHDTRRIDYAFLKNGSTALSLNAISVPDWRATCPHGLVAGGAMPSCSPEVVGGPNVSGQQWDIEDDFGVRPSDHNALRVALDFIPQSVAITRCAWHLSPICQ